MPDRPAQATRRGVIRGAAGSALAVGGTAVGLAAGRAGEDDPRSPATVSRRRTRGRGRRPNVVVVSVDDLGWADLGCYGNTFHRTPHLDRIAERGMRFTQAYAAAPNCSPSRAALLTGHYPARSGITDYLREESGASNLFLKPGRGSAARMLGSRGYTTGLVGKWHLTETYSGSYRSRPGNPYDHGFDEVIASEELYIAAGDYFHPYFFMPTLPAREPGEHLTDRLATESVEFIERHRDEPFFLLVSNYAVHSIVQGKPALVEEYAARPGAGTGGNDPEYAANLHSVDEQVGRIVRTLDRLGIAEDTLLLVTSDNGSPRRASTKPLRGGKGSLSEGGIRVPLLASWPGRVPAGAVSDAVVSGVDVLPTAWELAGGSGRDFDGTSLVGVLTGGRAAPRELFWAFPHFFGDRRPCAAVRSGRHKAVTYLRRGVTELYDLEADPGETTDLAREEPELTAELAARLQAHLAEVRLLPPAPTKDAYPVVRTAAHPPSDRFALVTSIADAATLGLVVDQANVLTVDYDADRRTVRWELRRGGVSQGAAAEPLRALDGSVDLEGADARLGICFRGSTLACYADPGAGWQFLFRIDVGGVIDLTSSQVRRVWRVGRGPGAGDPVEIRLAA